MTAREVVMWMDVTALIVGATLIGIALGWEVGVGAALLAFFAKSPPSH